MIVSGRVHDDDDAKKPRRRRRGVDLVCAQVGSSNRRLRVGTEADRAVLVGDPASGMRPGNVGLERIRCSWSLSMCCKRPFSLPRAAGAPPRCSACTSAGSCRRDRGTRFAGSGGPRDVVQNGTAWLAIMSSVIRARLRGRALARSTTPSTLPMSETCPSETPLGVACRSRSGRASCSAGRVRCREMGGQSSSDGTCSCRQT